MLVIVTLPILSGVLNLPLPTTKPPQTHVVIIPRRSLESTFSYEPIFFIAVRKVALACPTHVS